MYCVSSVVRPSGSFIAVIRLPAPALRTGCGLRPFETRKLYTAFRSPASKQTCIQPSGWGGVAADKFDELAVVHLHKDLGHFVVFARNGERLLIAELGQKGDFAIQVADAKCDVADALMPAWGAGGWASTVIATAQRNANTAIERRCIWISFPSTISRIAEFR